MLLTASAQNVLARWDGIMARTLMLIVDDETDLLAGAWRTLAWSGLETAEAADGTEGLAKAESPQPNVILLDARMRGLDGYEVCRRLKANPATTHSGDFPDEVGGCRPRPPRLPGGRACVPRPVWREALQGSVTAALAIAKRREEPKAGNDGDGQ